MSKLFSVFKSNNKNIFSEIDKSLKKFSDNVDDLIKENSLNFQQSNNSNNHKLKLDKVKKGIENLYKLFFDKKNFNEKLFESVIGKKFIKLLTDYITFNILDLSEVIFPYIMKILFQNKENLKSIGLNDEVLLMNTQIINCVKVLIKSFIELIKINKNSVFIEDQIIPFVFHLMDVLTYYPNFYYAISASTNQEGNNNNFIFDSNLFELIITLFSIEHSFKIRKNKKFIRKFFLKC